MRIQYERDWIKENFKKSFRPVPEGRGNEDFIILDGGNALKEGGRNKQKPEEPLYVIIKNDANFANLQIIQSLWAAFSTFHLFFIPALFCLILGYLYLLIGMKDDISYVNSLNPVMMSLFGVSVFVGLPLHVLALGELEDALYEAEEIYMRMNAGTQTADDNVDQADSDTGQSSDTNSC